MNETINNDSLFLDKERNIRKYGIEDLNEKNVLPIINRSQKNYALSDKLWDYIEDNLNSERVDEFGKHFTNLDLLDYVNNGGIRTEKIENLIEKKPKVITEEELGFVNLSLKASNWDLDNVPMPSLVMGDEMEKGNLQNVIMGKISKNMSHFAKEGKEDWDVFMDVYAKLNDIAQNFDPNYDFGNKYNFDKLLRQEHGNDVIDNASPSKLKRLLNNKKLGMYLKSNIDRTIYSLIREDQMAKGMTSAQTEINSDYKQAQQMYGNDAEKIAGYVGDKRANSDRKNKIRIDESTMLKHGKALKMQDTVYLDTNISSDGRETTIGELVEDGSKNALDNMEEQESLKEIVDNLDKFFETDAMMTSSDGADFAWMEAKKFAIDRDPATGDMVINALTPGEINKIKESTYLEAKKRQVMRSFRSNREKVFGMGEFKALDHNLYEDLKNVNSIKELDECLLEHVKKARDESKKIPNARSFNVMKINTDVEKTALAETQAYFRQNDNVRDVRSIIKEMDDLSNFLDPKIKDKVKDLTDTKEIGLILQKRDEKFVDVLDDKIEMINESRMSENKAPFPQSWKRGLFELYNMPMKNEWEESIKFQDYYEKLIAGEYKDDIGTQSLQVSLWDSIGKIDKENEKVESKTEVIKETAEYEKNEIGYEEVNFLFDSMLEMDKDRSRDETNREMSHSLW